jgi:hypothetical protein
MPARSSLLSGWLPSAIVLSCVLDPGQQPTACLVARRGLPRKSNQHATRAARTATEAFAPGGLLLQLDLVYPPRLTLVNLASNRRSRRRGGAAPLLL